MKDINTHSYKHFLGTDLIDNLGGKDDPNAPFKAPPKDPKDYKIYRSYYEEKMNEILDGQGVVKISAQCEGKDDKLRPIFMKRQKPDHFGCSFVFACNHVIHQDPENPEGVTFVPFQRDSTRGFFVCGTCLKLFQKNRLDMNSICCKCSLCVLDSLNKIMEKKPDRIRDLRAL